METKWDTFDWKQQARGYQLRPVNGRDNGCLGEQLLRLGRFDKIEVVIIERRRAGRDVIQSIRPGETGNIEIIAAGQHRQQDSD